MHGLCGSIASLRVLALLAVLACSGCTDTALLCEARLTPINIAVAPVAPPQNKGARP